MIHSRFNLPHFWEIFWKFGCKMNEKILRRLPAQFTVSPILTSQFDTYLLMQERARLEMERLARHEEELQLHAKKHDERRERKERERERREEEKKQKELERIGKI